MNLYLNVYTSQTVPVIRMQTTPASPKQPRHPSRHFRIEPTHTIRPDYKIRRMKLLRLHKLQNAVAQHGLIGDMQAPIDVTYLADTVILLRYLRPQAGFGAPSR
jgi:hypothetical protein